MVGWGERTVRLLRMTDSDLLSKTDADLLLLG